MALHDRLPQFRNAGDDGIPGEIAFDRRDRGVFDVARGRKMRFPGAKIHQLGALGAQSGSLCSDRHGGGNLNAADTVGRKFW